MNSLSRLVYGGAQAVAVNWPARVRPAGEEPLPSVPDVAAHHSAELELRVEEVTSRVTAEVTTRLNQHWEAVLREREQAAFHAGSTAASASAAEALDRAAEKLAEAILQCQELFYKEIRRTELETARTAVAIARHVLHCELKSRPDEMEALITAAFERARPQQILRVRVHPECRNTLYDALARLGSHHTEILDDPLLPEWSVIFETRRDSVDASVETQLREVGRGISRYLAEHQ